MAFWVAESRDCREGELAGRGVISRERLILISPNKRKAAQFSYR